MKLGRNMYGRCSIARYCGVIESTVYAWFIKEGGKLHKYLKEYEDKTLDGKIVKIYKSRIGKNLSKALSGTIVNIYKDGIGVKTIDGEIIIEELKIEGKKKVKASEYLNGIDKDNLLGRRFMKE